MKPKANIEYRATADLKLLEHNPRTIKKADFERLKTSIKNNAEFFEARCAIGDRFVHIKHGESDHEELVAYWLIVKAAKKYIDELGGFEKLAEWGLF